MPRERDRLVADALHQAAVAGDDVDVVVDDVAAEARVQHALRDRHADRVGETLAERARGRLDARGMAVFGMAGGLGAHLPEALQLPDVHPRIAGEVEERVEQHGAVAGRQDEAVAVGPLGVGGVEAQRLAEEHGGDIGHAHRHARVTRLCRLHGVHRQRPDGIRHVLVQDVGVRDGLRRRGLLARLGHVAVPFCGRCAGRLVPRTFSDAAAPRLRARRHVSIGLYQCVLRKELSSSSVGSPERAPSRRHLRAETAAAMRAQSAGACLLASAQAKAP